MSEFMFKKGDRVRNLLETDLVKIGELGRVTEDDECPYVKWDNGKTTLRDESDIELITEEQPKHKTEQVIYGPQEKKEFLPGPVVKLDGAPQPNTIEWWRWHYAGLAMQANRSERGENSAKIAQWAVNDANALIAELQKKGGQS